MPASTRIAVTGSRTFTRIALTPDTKAEARKLGLLDTMNRAQRRAQQAARRGKR